MDPLILSRIQFGANISFHILFPTITIALGWVLLFFKLRYNATNDSAWMRAYFTWVKVFALSFAMGVVSGVTMSFQFGTNWPGYMEKVGNIAGPLLAYEILTAFFLEAAFLGIMLFGFRRVSNRVHTLATVLVAGGTTLSAFWIIALNSWMQTPAGFEMRDGVAHPVDWWAIVFNPSMPYRLTHMLLASGLTVSFLIAGLSALRYLTGDRSESMWKALRTGVFTAAILIPIQIFAGDQHGLNTLEHQPQKIAAMEANWNTGPNVPLVLFAFPTRRRKENKFEIAIPDGASLVLRHSPSGVVPGLNDYPGNHPPVFPVFWGFRIMVGTGILMLLVSWSATYLPQAPPQPAEAAGHADGADGAVGLAGHAGRLVHHRDRPPALAGHRRAEDRRCGRPGRRQPCRADAGDLSHPLCAVADRLSRRAGASGAEGGQGRRQPRRCPACMNDGHVAAGCRRGR